MLFTYPFPAAATDAVRGDFTNLRVTADIDLRALYSQLPPPPSGGPTLPIPSLPIPTLPIPTLPIPTLPLPSICPTLPGLPVPPGCPTPKPTAPGGGGLCPPICLPGQSGVAGTAAEPAIDTGLLGLLLGGYIS
jgi:phospholipid/cholesterol/gamma-HCH transport system substrate-binding protein